MMTIQVMFQLNKKLINIYGSGEEDLAIKYNNQKIYLFFEAVHLMKSIRNNFFNRKIFLLPSFLFENPCDPINVPGGDISWQMFHQVFERDSNLHAHVKAPPKLPAKVLHPGNCKQSVPIALAIFHPSTAAPIKHYFPDKTDSAELLNLFYTWWTISNSKTPFNSAHRLGGAAVAGDNELQFLRGNSKLFASP